MKDEVKVMKRDDQEHVEYVAREFNYGPADRMPEALINAGLAGDYDAMDAAFLAEIEAGTPLVNKVNGQVFTKAHQINWDWHCEHCSARGMGERPYEGQVCDRCISKWGPAVYVIQDDDADDNKRFCPGLENVAEFFNEGMYYGQWLEFNDREYTAIGKEWDQLPEVKGGSLEELRATVASRIRFMTDFWFRHEEIREARAAEQQKWKAEGVAAWQWDMPEFIVPEIKRVDNL
jgi:hypothetical protein